MPSLLWLRSAAKIGRASCREKSVDLGGRRIIKKKNQEARVERYHDMATASERDRPQRRRLERNGDLFRVFFFFSSRRRHTRYWRDWSSDVCSSDLKRCVAHPCFEDRARLPSQSASDRKSTRLNSSHANISYAVFCLKKKKNTLTAFIFKKKKKTKKTKMNIIINT